MTLFVLLKPYILMRTLDPGRETIPASAPGVVDHYCGSLCAHV
jgi:hypothetical protein